MTTSPGVGKTHLAVALATQAIESGFSVAFYRIDELLYQLKRDAETAPSRLKHRKYMASSLLVIDEMGFEPFTREQASLFFRVVNYRYEKGSICITTNKGIAQWPQMLADDEALASAILDRLLHASHVLNIKGRSYRLKDLEDQLGAARGSGRIEAASTEAATAAAPATTAKQTDATTAKQADLS